MKNRTYLYTKYGAAFNWSQIGVTPMLGVNDVQSEVFKLADVDALEAFAVSKGIGELSMWSINRDVASTGSAIGQASPGNSGLSDTTDSFGKAFSSYGDRPAMGSLVATGTAVTPTDVSLELQFGGTGWGVGFQANVTMKNAGGALDSWTTSFITANKITSIWDAKLDRTVQLADGQYLYTVSNLAWNGSLGCGGTANWGFVAQSAAGKSVTTVSNADFSVLQGKVVTGTTGNDSLTAAKINTVLIGYDGNDTLKGGTGNDSLFGGNGTNTLAGGAGSDKFHWEQDSSGMTTVTDLENIDKLVLYLKSGQSLAAKVTGSDLLIGSEVSGLFVKNWTALGSGASNTLQSGAGKSMLIVSDGKLV